MILNILKKIINSSPGQWSPYHLCGKSKCFLSEQSSVAASSWLKTSAASSASRPSAACPWAWRSAVSPGQGLPLQVSHFWIELPNTTRRQLVKMARTTIPSVLCHSRSYEILPKHQLYSTSAEHFLFLIWICISLSGLREQLAVAYFCSPSIEFQADRKLPVWADQFPVEGVRLQLWLY